MRKRRGRLLTNVAVCYVTINKIMSEYNLLSSSQHQQIPSVFLIVCNSGKYHTSANYGYAVHS